MSWADGELSIALDDDSVSRSTLDTLLLLLQIYKPTIIVEAGTYKASFAITAVTALKNATVYTADAVTHPWEQFRDRNAIPPERIRFHRGDFAELVTRWPELVGAVDFALVDSGWPVIEHEPGMRLRHFRLAQHWVKVGGVVAVDDMYGRWDGVEDIARECCLVIPTDRGLGVWRKHT